LRTAAVSDIHAIHDESDELLLAKIRNRVEEIEPDGLLYVASRN